MSASMTAKLTTTINTPSTIVPTRWPLFAANEPSPSPSPSPPSTTPPERRPASMTRPKRMARTAGMNIVVKTATLLSIVGLMRCFQVLSGGKRAKKARGVVDRIRWASAARGRTVARMVSKSPASIAKLLAMPPALRGTQTRPRMRTARATARTKTKCQKPRKRPFRMPPMLRTWASVPRMDAVRGDCSDDARALEPTGTYPPFLRRGWFVLR